MIMIFIFTYWELSHLSFPIYIYMLSPTEMKLVLQYLCIDKLYLPVFWTWMTSCPSEENGKVYIFHITGEINIKAFLTSALLFSLHMLSFNIVK